MTQLELRPTLRLVNQIANIERLSGRWDRICQILPFDTMAEEELVSGAEAMLALDSSSPVAKTKLHEESLQALIEAHSVTPNFTRSGLESLCGLLARTIKEGGHPSLIRTHPAYFTASSLGEEALQETLREEGEEMIFPTISAFLIEKRLSELLIWLERELREGRYHPLIIIPTFHLLFLQIHPFQTANHRLSLLLLQYLLQTNNYPFAKKAHFAPHVLANGKNYFSSLRQAEKTVHHSWQTLNVWLEFFLDSLLDTLEKLIGEHEKMEQTTRLTTVQRRIIDVVKIHGNATREKIAQHTGINLSTVKYNLSILADKGQLKREGGGRTTSYRVL